MPSPVTKLDVESLIDKAFASVCKPSKVTNIKDLHCEDYEKRDIEQFFSSRSRDEITLDVLQKEYPGDYTAILFFMEEKAVLYFLPLFMKLCLNHYDEVDVLPGALILLFAGGSSKEEKEYLAGLLSRFNDEQREAILAYLFYMQVRHEDDFFGLDSDDMIAMYKAKNGVAH